MKVPLLPFIDKVEEFSVVAPAPMVENIAVVVRVALEAPRWQCTDKVVDVPDVQFLNNSSVLPVERTIELCQVQLVQVVHVQQVHTDVVLERRRQKQLLVQFGNNHGFPQKSTRRSCWKSLRRLRRLMMREFSFVHKEVKERAFTPQFALRDELNRGKPGAHVCIRTRQQNSAGACSHEAHFSHGM